MTRQRLPGQGADRGHKQWWRVGVPLLLVGLMFGLNVGDGWRPALLYSLALIAFIVAFNAIVNPDLFRRRR